MSIRRLPELVVEFGDMAKGYLVQEALRPIKQLGHLAGFSLGTAVAWAAASILVAVAALRVIIDLLPESPYWEALGYLLTVLALVGVGAIIIRLGPRREAEPPGEVP